MNFLELQVTLSFCMIFLLRMLGMFMIIPVLSKYGALLDGSNNFLIGLSMGIYGIAQVIFQIPFGFLSDKFGKTKIIMLGLFLFFFGNFVSATFHSIWGLIIGRFLQGSGAISGVCMAFLSDLIRKENYIKSVAFIGISFACSFLIAMVISPIVVGHFGFFSIFWISSYLSIICMIIVYFVLPFSENIFLKKKKKILFRELIKILFNKNFFKSYLGIFFLHVLLLINFMIIPNQFEVSGCFFNDQWKLYLVTILISFFILFFFIFYCKLQIILDNIIEICIFFIFVSETVFLFSKNNLLLLIIALQVFFIAFNFLEVFLPANLRKQKLLYTGSVMSIYSTSQFLGISFGGLISGWLYSFLSVSEIFLCEVFIVVMWLVYSIFLRCRSL
ncbi:MFS transporter [Buchnera aphidicola]|uniref:MFS transporter n=1 Tax=Buchnera aphidicola (Lipaphis pseudobrassicae) TaxID=1258543 RepID=A0A4D6Y9I9_9GAMM|nr:MFS transporter [Buchnera aphidicola]QCI22460.1 MFS transporter [Buchnera aphidicola (Lipaphis pseudobrassicae)]